MVVHTSPMSLLHPTMHSPDNHVKLVPSVHVFIRKRKYFWDVWSLEEFHLLLSNGMKIQYIMKPFQGGKKSAEKNFWPIPGEVYHFIFHSVWSDWNSQYLLLSFYLFSIFTLKVIFLIYHHCIGFVYSVLNTMAAEVTDFYCQIFRAQLLWLNDWLLLFFPSWCVILIVHIWLLNADGILLIALLIKLTHLNLGCASLSGFKCRNYLKYYFPGFILWK